MPYKNTKNKNEWNKVWRDSERGKEWKDSYRTEINELHKKYRQSEKGKLVQRAKAKRMREKYPEKWSARAKVRYAVRVGKLKKLSCEVCDNPNTAGHHDDYTKPLDVRWLCMPHHREAHNNKS